MVDANTSIYRPTNENDKTFIEVDMNDKRLTVEEKFLKELQKAEKEATKNGLPFASHAAKDDFKDLWEASKTKQKREYGYVKDLTPPKVDFKQYSDKKNFEVVEEKEVPDTNLSKNNPGLQVALKTTVYKYKGYHNKYSVMESASSAIARAQKKVSATRS